PTRGGLAGAGFGGARPSVDGVVAVDDGDVHILGGGGQQPGLQLHDLVVVGVVRDVIDGGGDARILLQDDEPLLVQQQQGTAAVGGVVGDGDLGALRQVVQGGGLAGVDAEEIGRASCRERGWLRWSRDACNG